MNLLVYGLLALAAASRVPEDVLEDLRNTYVESRTFRHRHTLRENSNLAGFGNDFDMYDVYSTVDMTDSEYGMLDFDIPLGDLPELREDYLTRGPMMNETSIQVANLVMELEAMDTPLAKMMLGDIYMFGHYGVFPDLQRSHNYYMEVVESNNATYEDLAHSHFMLGVMFHTGVLGHHEQSHAKGLIHYDLAEDLGSKQATMALAHMYQYGIGVAQNDETALFYYTKLFNYIEDRLEPFKRDLNVNNGTARELITEVNFDKFSFRLADLFGGTYPDSVSYVRPSLRSFETKQLYYNFKNNDNVEEDEMLPEEEVALNERMLDYYIKVQSHYKGDYLHSRNYFVSRHLAMAALKEIEGNEIFKLISNGQYKYDRPEWAVYTGRILMYLAHMNFRGEAGPIDYQVAMKYAELGRKFTSSKIFATDLSNMYIYGLGTERNFTKGQEKMLSDKLTVAQMYHYHISNLDLADENYSIDGTVWNALSYVASYDYHLGERAIVKLWLEGRNNDDATANIVRHLANYVKLYEPMFFNFRETFMASVNGDMWKALMGFLVQSELGYEYAQNSLSTLLFPTVGQFSDKKFRFDADVHSRVFTPRRYTQAVRYLELSTKHGNPDSMNHLGDMYYWGLPKDPRPQLGDYNVGSIFWPNSPKSNVEMLVPSNPLRSVALYHDSANSGSHMGMFNLGWMYEFGVGVAQDLHLAKRYYDQAMTKSQVGYVGIKLSLWRIWLKGKLWGLLGLDAGVAKARLGWYTRALKVLNWNSLQTGHDEL